MKPVDQHLFQPQQSWSARARSKWRRLYQAHHASSILIFAPWLWLVNIVQAIVIAVWIYLDGRISISTPGLPLLLASLFSCVIATALICRIEQREGSINVILARLRIGFIGRMSTAKGLDVLADAIGMLPETANATLVIAGDDRFVPLSDSASVGLALEKIRSRVTVAGWIDRDEFHSRVDLVVVPSVWDEPFGLVAAESLARHKPLLVTDAGALPEIVGVENPWIVPRNDASSIKARILQMVDQPAETKSAIETGYFQWLTRYSPQAGTARMRQLLTGLSQTR
jgi:glycosyltransferase involved in cell wall biosynthesis